MAKANRRLQLGRKKASRQKGKRHLIVTNGKVTESGYFQCLINEKIARGRVVVRVIEGDPLSVVKAVARKVAIESGDTAQKEGYESWSSVWVVTDTDDFCNLEAAERHAKKSGIKLCLSNPCFEVWLIDHIEACSPSFSTSRACEQRAKSLGVIVPTNSRRSGLSKCKEVNTELIEGNTSAALNNAAKHNTPEKKAARISNVDNKSGYSVWTDVPFLIEEIFGLEP